ncbi:hypothetical protein JRO89_XS04G0258100 [Xanthoceras sorbifolium]|uniref:SUI1 domain-containing protein n=1 Tax=Xanthoceras sorbifolium TaxID=99658 RepID=A0ABQ8I754_9ROSI|nr:hypothetical protein JRO89_XS04G0258100 [Xanthoceras sorbifolium]
MGEKPQPKCKPWLIQNAHQLYPHLLEDANEKEKAEKVSASGGADGGAASGFLDDIKEKLEVFIEKVVRKCITIVKRLDLFGVKLSDASKKLGKKFATGASVANGPTEKEQIDVQGDISYDIVEFITETWPAVILLTIFSFMCMKYKGCIQEQLKRKFALGKKENHFTTSSWLVGMKFYVPETAIYFIEDGKKVAAT